MLTIELLWIYYKVRPDIILHFTIKPNIYGTIAARILNIPVINNVCGLGTIFMKKSFVSIIGSLLYKLAFRYPRKVFFQNTDDLQLFTGKKLISPIIAEIIPGSGVDLNKFSPSGFLRNKIFTFLLISRLIKDKGVIEFIESIKVINSLNISAKFQILGAKDEKHKRGVNPFLIDLWANEGLIEYLGTTVDVRPFINKADCIVLPSYREGIPRVLLEAASCAKPIIASNVPGCKQVVQENFNGFLCRVQDQFSLAAKMIKMINSDHNTLKTFGENGRKKMELEFCETRVTQKYIQAIRQVIQA
jgi:glycosyltransferase involved in cell wall biosynthesis